jgi:transcription elongation factor GreA
MISILFAMGMSTKKVITKGGLKKLENELKQRTTLIRQSIADKLDKAKAIGDLSENTAYTAALEEYQMNEAKINELKSLLAHVEVAPDKSGDARIDIGDKIEIKDLSNDSIQAFTLVGEGEGDPVLGQLSANSVVGKSLLGKKRGDIVHIELPRGKKEYQIISVE